MVFVCRHELDGLLCRKPPYFEWESFLVRQHHLKSMCSWNLSLGGEMYNLSVVMAFLGSYMWWASLKRAFCAVMIMQIFLTPLV